MDVPKLKFKFTFFRKGTLHPWSTSLWLDNDVADQAEFEELVDACTTGSAAKLQDCFFDDVYITDAHYYAPGSDIIEYARSMSLQGTLTGTGAECPSDAASLARWATDFRTSKMHPIYLFNYLHGCRSNPAVPGGDTLAGAQNEAQTAFFQRFVDGIVAGGTTVHRCGPAGQVAQEVHVENFITHRDFRK